MIYINKYQPCEEELFSEGTTVTLLVLTEQFSRRDLLSELNFVPSPIKTSTVTCFLSGYQQTLFLKEQLDFGVKPPSSGKRKEP